MYNKDSLLKVWRAVPYNSHRYWAFKRENGTWFHSDSVHSTKQVYNNFEEFYHIITTLKVHDIHVKKTVMGGREWVIDVDHDETDPAKIALKNIVAHCTLVNFFGKDMCTKILFSGNRGLHVWLSCAPGKFDMDISPRLRSYYYDNVFKVPKNVNKVLLKPGSFLYCFFLTFNNTHVQRQIAKLYPNKIVSDHNWLLKEFYPIIDRQVFTSTKQIRAPYSYNSKGRQFSADHHYE
ncbi:lef-1 [Hyphantria cunea granulovirus]|uniref:Lef-1 n=1 Tax=Hyphantria cunea granulovirus TaxID=307448 RepID=A0AAF1D283_9BBAC|nr:lef-1 [Hyphantria cunea granulovirus]QBQ01617.1 lef-1 [Hyphantria cunea granulovirus]